MIQRKNATLTKAGIPTNWPHFHRNQTFPLPLPRTLRGRAPREASRIPPPKLQPLLHTQLQLPLQILTWFFPMDEVAESTPDTPFPRVQSTTSFSEIGNRTELAIYRSSRVPPRIERIACSLCGFFVLEPGVDVADEMVIVVITNYHLFHLTVLAHLAEEILVKRVKVVLQLRGVHLVFGVEGRILVEVGEEDCLRV